MNFFLYLADFFWSRKIPNVNRRLHSIHGWIFLIYNLEQIANWFSLIWLNREFFTQSNIFFFTFDSSIESQFHFILVDRKSLWMLMQSIFYCSRPSLELFIPCSLSWISKQRNATGNWLVCNKKKSEIKLFSQAKKAGIARSAHSRWLMGSSTSNEYVACFLCERRRRILNERGAENGAMQNLKKKP